MIICGSGAAGLTLAIDLARRQVGFRLIDKAPRPFAGSRGKGIQPRTQEVFEDLGVIDRIVASGGEYPLMRVYTEDGPVDKAAGVLPDPTPDEPYHMALLVPQFLTERRLRERLAELGHAPEYGHELVGFDQDADGVTALIATPGGERTLRAKYLIGADGGSSFVRKTLGIGFPGKTLGVRALVADVRVDGVSPDFWHRWGTSSPEQQISLCPLYGTDMFQYQAPVPFDVEVDLSADGLTALIRERTGRGDIVIRDVSWASVFEMNARLADTYQRGRVLLAGDSAHCHPPTGGQGLNTSVQDAYNLGWKLAAVLDGAPEWLLSSYEKERRPIAEGVLGLSEKLLDAARKGDARRGREVTQLDLGYPDSPLNLTGPDRDKGVIVGDRAPDAPVTGAGGLGTRLFSLFQGPHWTLLGYEADGASAPEPRQGLRIHIVGADILDTGGHVRDAYGLSPGEWVLIRPDGYVAAVVGTVGLGSIETYLNAVGVGRP
ncbi:2-polyprenyl-6-methoxyphenol hydroxylase-like FAD-dependent oxidoreductase [Thermocatellispora tengchongensis]|uniref:2-polyprenyl-6-methoxyphenol hydroxylase-like FAD-dependent oxidoreductase n=1 Tax=Thermocatellispora tengchongensis TaxID=1073253 RepID=A0A840NP83_9ACTN|nr:FAD-dependent oxidoreductase [Thermocatellispora tengchongensis]MBB5130324.1 2-polyprenyl-6-methoxyphenol hydroxylase-like FAD-dependent oxidoreductase [Thermocatellispora tengchongensis]